MPSPPSFPLYVRDWIVDLEEHPLEIEGAWIRFCTKAWLDQTRCSLTKTLAQFGNLWRVSPERALEILRYIQEEEIGDVALDLTEISHDYNGKITVISRRMERSESGKENNRVRQRRYQQRKKDNGDVTGDSRQPAPPSSFSSSSSLSTTPLSPNGDIPPSGESGGVDSTGQDQGQVLQPERPKAKPKRKPYPAAFESAWSAAHKGMKDCGKSGALKSWERARKMPDYPGDEELANTLSLVRSKWEFEGKEKIPYLTTWLNQGRWNTPEVEAILAEERRRDEQRVQAQAQAQEREQKDAQREEHAARVNEFWSGLGGDERSDWLNKARATGYNLRHKPDDDVLLIIQAKKLAWEGRGTNAAA